MTVPRWLNHILRKPPIYAGRAGPPLRDFTGEFASVPARMKLTLYTDYSLRVLAYLAARPAHGFGGTPVIVRPADGAVLEGYRPAAVLREFLRAAPTPSPKG